MTLGILAIVTLLVIAFATSMRVENMASKNFNDAIKARELAQAAVDQAVATIRQSTQLRTNSPAVSTYVTFPGYAMTNHNGVVGPIALYSAPLSVDIVNMNDGFWITGQNPVEYPPPTAPQMNVGWIYVDENGNVGPTTPLSTPAVPLVGRFAFWVDDEASKININTAWTRGPANPVTLDPFSTANAAYGAPNEVDLSALLPGLNAFVGVIQGRQTLPPGFTTIEEVKLVDTSVPPIPDSNFNTNRFYLTTYSDDAYFPGYTADLDVFDRPRRVLSSLTNTPDIDGSADGAYTRLADPLLAKVFSPSVGAPVGSFATKYGANGLKQIIANIIAYQIDPTTTAPPDDAANTPPNYLGLARTPYINEAQVRYDTALDPATGNTNVTQIVSVELFYMYNGTYAPAPDTVTIPSVAAVAGLPAGPFVFNIPAAPAFSSGSIYYYSITNGPVQATTWPQPIPAQTIDITYGRLYGGVPKRLDFARVPLPPGADLNAFPMSSIQGAEANDPAVNDNGVTTPSEWTPYTSAGTLGVQNNAYNPPADPTLLPKALPSKAVMRIGPMNSIGELGFIHTPNSWQYLTLQPGGGATPGDGQIPDWAILDFFAVGAPYAGPTPTRGRININSSVPLLPIATTRLIPLEALLNTLVLPATLPTVAADIYHDNNTVRTDKYGMQAPPDGVFDTIGEICEVLSLANGATTQAGKEATIRRIANLITVRSNTFTVWVIAQSIKEPNLASGQTFGTFQPGVDIITGEVRAQAVVERYEDPPPPSATAVKFRTKYFRYIYQ
jgi:hypothetical protein